MSVACCLDVGSTFTKAALVDIPSGALLATASHPTTIATDVLDGVAAVRAQVERSAGATADTVLACSSAGGGLRVAVIGYERAVTAEAGYRVALSAGGRVVHVHAGRLDGAGLSALREARPDVLLLVGGTDGGNADVLLHNAARLAAARFPVPVVLAGNADAAGQAQEALNRRGRRVIVTANVLPRIGVLDPMPAREAIREVFLRHVIGGKGLSRGPAFARMVRGATPDVVLAGVEVLADGSAGPAPGRAAPGAGDVLVVDVGGATTDVYSVLTPRGPDAVPGREVVATLWRSRTVEADLGMRWNAPGVVDAAVAEMLLDPVEADHLGRQARLLAADPGYLPADAAAAAADARLAELAVTVAARRHGRPAREGAPARALRDVALVVGSGGVLRHADATARAEILAPLIGDHAGGWRVPEGARLAVDARYTLFAAGLLASLDAGCAARVARAGLEDVGAPESSARPGAGERV